MIEYGEDIRRKVLQGANRMADAMKVTLGPYGRYVALSTEQSKPLITNDGATIADAIDFEDPFEDMGAQIIKEVAARTNEKAGDGTTTAAVLARQIVSEGFKQVAAGANPVALRRGIFGATEVAVAAIRKLSHPVTTPEEVAGVATLSSKDAAIGNMVAQALHSVGTDGIVRLDESMTPETTLEIIAGMVLDRGFLLPAMATDKEHGISELKDPYVLVTDRPLADPEELLPLLDAVSEQQKPLLIIAESLEGQALATVMTNIVHGTLETVAIHPPAYGEGRRAMMDDIAVFTGGTYFTAEMGVRLCDATLDQLGRTQSVRIEPKRTTLVGGAGTPESVASRIQSLKAMIAQTEYAFAKKQLEERLAKLTDGIAVISVGAATEPEMKERKLRFEDAVNAAKAALEEGIVPGGGCTLLAIAPAIEAYANTLQGDAKVGASLILHALQAPLHQIASNAGKEGAAVVAHAKALPGRIGFNAATGEYVDMIETGIIDSAKVTRLALANAASASSLLLTVEAAIARHKL